VPLASGIGSLLPPIGTPICDTVVLDAHVAGENESRPVEVLTPEIFRAWVMWFTRMAMAVANGTGGTPSTSDLYLDLTPAATVTPALELAAENGTFGILLDRATTTIAPSTLDGLVPPDGYRFSFLLINDATDGREVVFDAAYVGCQETSGVAAALESYSFVTVGGVFVCTAQNIGIL